MKIISYLRLLFSQRYVVYLLTAFLFLVLFNTTYLSLGTYAPLGVIILGFLYAIGKKISLSGTFVIMIGYVILVTASTVFSGGDDFREIFKILLTLLFVIIITNEKYTGEEVRFISLMICVLYSIYAVMVINSLGGDTAYYGRAQIRILNSNIPLDPNVTAAVFVLPMTICLINLLYGKYKLLSVVLLSLFFVACVLLGSRGAFASIVIVSSILLFSYYIKANQSILVKIIISAFLFVVVSYLMFYLSTADDILGLDRILGNTDDLQGGNGRIEIWKDRLDLLSNSPLWGYGTNYNLGRLAGTATHNTILQIIYYGGLIGTFLFFIPLIRLYKRPVMSKYIKLALFISVLMPIFFIDTLQERTLWNFLIYYEILSSRENADDCLIWFN